MLRSLDPDTGFTSPKSKNFRPKGKEVEKFSKGELEYIDAAEESDKDLVVARHVRNQAREAAIAAATGQVSKG